MPKRLRIRLIEPSRYLADGRLLRGNRLLFPSLALPLLAALTPRSADVTIQNEFFEDINFDEPVDLVGITAYTSRALRAYEIADEFRRRNVPVVMGGIHVSMVPDEAAEHADTVIIGEAEETWPRFIEDFQAGRAESRYRAERPPSLDDLPVPRFSLLSRSHYLSYRQRGLSRFAPTSFIPVQTARGCPHACEFCSVSVFNGREYRARPIASVINEIKSLGTKVCFFVDDDIFAVPERARELFNALVPLGISWFGQGSISAVEDVALLDLARRSGCLAVFFGLESLVRECLRAMGKTHNVVEDYERHLKVCRDLGISVMASMMFGFGPEEPAVFDEACDFLIRNQVPYAAWWPLIPFPGTRFFARLRREGRLKSDRWWLDPAATARFTDLKFTGVKMGEDVFRRNFRRAFSRFYSFSSIARRLLLPPQERWPRKAALNLLFRRRMSRDTTILET